MVENSALAAIRKAKVAHIKWRSYAQALIAGVEVTDDKVPKMHTECDFGKWYYGSGKNALGHLDSFKGIEAPHEMLHAIYGKIFDALHGGERHSLVERVFSSKSSLEWKRMEIARGYIDELVNVSETLLEAINLLEDEIRQSEVKE